MEARWKVAALGKSTPWTGALNVAHALAPTALTRQELIQNLGDVYHQLVGRAAACTADRMNADERCVENGARRVAISKSSLAERLERQH